MAANTPLLISLLCMIILSSKAQSDLNKITIILDDTVNSKTILIDSFKKNENVKELSIEISGNNTGWVVFDDSPTGDYHCSYSYNKKLGRLPDSIIELNAIEVLDISYLGLEVLPKDFAHLSNLQSLNISFNEISLLDEIDKLQQLKKLTILRFYGCKFDKSTFDVLAKRLPNVKLLFSKDQYLNDMKIK
jgi:hypothetical protein